MSTIETPDERRARRRRDAEERGQLMRLYLKTSTAGLEVGLSVVVGAMLGFFADRHFGSAPWGMLVGLAFGCAAGGRKLFRIVKAQERAAEKESRADG